MKIGVIGQGYVGLPISMAAAGVGYEIIGFDNNPALVLELNSGKSHISDVKNSELSSFLESKNLIPSS